MQFTYVFYFFEFFFFIFLQEKLLNKIVLKQNKSNLAIRLCLPDDVMTTVMTSVTWKLTLMSWSEPTFISVHFFLT